MDQDSPVARAGLELIHFEVLPYSWIEGFKNIYEGKVKAQHQKGMQFMLTLKSFLSFL